ncbi:MAG: hypothetical protein LBQ46_12465 [Treponema sp.]|jgi:hypothetical protein|nr:hypothetical protein [Treponema sp.]
MKNIASMAGLPAAFLVLTLFSCASVKIPPKTLTPKAIEYDIQGREPNGETDFRFTSAEARNKSLKRLADCQFYISKEIILRYDGISRSTELNQIGFVEVKNLNIRETIIIFSSTPGILQYLDTANGERIPIRLFEPVPGQDEDRQRLTLKILFDENYEDYIPFTALYYLEDDRFILAAPNDEVYLSYTGKDSRVPPELKYKIEYEGDDIPYLKYILVEHTEIINESRKAPGRTIRDENLNRQNRQ